MEWYFWVIIGVGIMGLSIWLSWIHGPTPFPPTGSQIRVDLDPRLIRGNEEIALELRKLRSAVVGLMRIEAKGQAKMGTQRPTANDIIDATLDAIEEMQ